LEINMTDASVTRSTKAAISILGIRTGLILLAIAQLTVILTAALV